MEENGKERRAATKGPLWAFGVRFGKPVLVLNLSKAMLLLTLLSHTVFTVLAFIACKFLFNCTHYVPSPSHLSVFPGIGKLSIFAASTQATLFLIASIGGYSRFKGAIADEVREGFLWLGVLITVLFPLLPAVNDVNAAEGALYERVHALGYYLTVVLIAAWLAIAVAAIQELRGSLNTEETVWYWRLKTCLKSIAVLCLLMAVQWKLSYSPHSGFLLNETALGVSSWLLPVLLLSLPAVISQFYRGFSVYLPLGDGYEKVAPEGDMTIG